MIPFGGEQRGQSFVERVGFSCETSSGGEHEGGEGSMFDFSNSLLICTLFDALVLSVASSRLGMSVRWGMGVKNPDVKVRSFKSASPDTVCCYVQPCSILMVGRGTSQVDRATRLAEEGSPGQGEQGGEVVARVRHSHRQNGSAMPGTRAGASTGSSVATVTSV